KPPVGSGNGQVSEVIGRFEEVCWSKRSLGKAHWTSTTSLQPWNAPPGRGEGHEVVAGDRPLAKAVLILGHHAIFRDVVWIDRRARKGAAQKVDGHVHAFVIDAHQRTVGPFLVPKVGLETLDTF